MALYFSVRKNGEGVDLIEEGTWSELFEKRSGLNAGGAEFSFKRVEFLGSRIVSTKLSFPLSDLLVACTFPSEDEL